MGVGELAWFRPVWPLDLHAFSLAYPHGLSYSSVTKGNHPSPKHLARLS